MDKAKLFENVVNATLDKCKETLVIKAKEYRRNNNPFHNFERGAELSGFDDVQVLKGFLLKHEVSINDIINDYSVDGILPTEAMLDEKIGDILNYYLILKAMFIQKIEERKSKQ